MLRNRFRAIIRLRDIVSRISRSLVSAHDQEIASAALESVAIEPADVALVIGLGKGWLVAELAARCSIGFVAGVDTSLGRVRQAARRNRVPLREGRIELLQATVSTLPYPDDMFDVVFALDGVRDWPDPVRNVREVARVTRAGGLLLLGVPQTPPNAVQADEIGDCLRQAGYESITERRMEVGDRRTAFLYARVPATGEG